MSVKDFNDSTICKETKIIQKLIDGKIENTIHMKLGAIIDSTDVEDEKDLVKIFLKFNSWDEYAEREGSETVKFRASKKLPSITTDGKEILRHYAYFGTKAPPLFRQWVRTVINYWEIPAVNNSLVAYKFLSDKTVNKLEGEEVLVGSEGMQHYEGVFLIFYDPESLEYIVYTEFFLLPEINMLLGFAIPPIERGLIALVKGMFQL